VAQNLPHLAKLAHECIILDACCLIDLHASGYMAEILQSLACPVAVSRYVLEQEALSVHTLSSYTHETGSETENAADDEPPLQQLFDSGIIAVVDIETEAEENALIDFAVYLDDGEAITCAIAVQRNWAVASTERKVASIMRDNFSHISVVPTQELIKHWVDQLRPAHEIVRQVINDIQVKARYRPRKNHSLYEWWQTFADD